MKQYCYLIDEKTGIGVDLENKTIFANDRPILEVYQVLKNLWHERDITDMLPLNPEFPLKLEDFIKPYEMML